MVARSATGGTGPLVGRRAELAAVDRALATAGGGPARVLEVVGEPGTGKSRLLAAAGELAGRRSWAVASARAVEGRRHVAGGLLAELDLVRAASGPLLIALDDVHWSDAASLGALAELGADSAVPLVVVAAYRPRQMPARLLAGLPVRSRLELGPLTMAETRELLAKTVDRPRHRGLYAASGGNPGYLRVLMDVADAADAETFDWDWPGVGAVRGELFGEVAALAPAALLLAQVAAVAGGSFDAELVATLAGRDPTQVAKLLGELVDRDIVRPDADGRGFRYRHLVVRWTVYRTAGAGWLLDAHARAAGALAGRGSPAVALAWHLERASDQAAVPVLAAAAEQVCAVSPARAAHWWSAAARLLPADPALGPQRLHLLASRARAWHLAGHHARSRELVHELLDLLPVRVGQEAVDAIRLAGAVERALGRHDEARALLEAELRRLDPLEPSAVSVKGDLAFACVHSGRWADVAYWATAVAGGTGEETDRVRALSALALAGVRQGRPRYAGEFLRRVEVLFDDRPDADLAWQAAWAAFALERDETALRLALRGTGTARRDVLPELLCVAAAAQVRLGRLAEARRTVDELWECAPSGPREELAALAHALLAEISLWQGDVKAGRRYAERAAGAAAPAAFGEPGGPDARRAWALLAGGDAKGCLAVLGAVTEPRWCALAAEAEVALGRPEAALRWADTAEQAAVRCPSPGRGAHARSARARAALAAGDADTAVRQAVLASKAFSALGWRPAQEQAEGVLAAARRRLRGEPPARAGTGGGLTRREREVARLVGLGHSNRHVADVLVLSPRTVELHVARILAKLGARSRTAIAAHVADDGPA